MTNDELWTHLLKSRQIAIVAFKNPREARGFFNGRSIISVEMLQSHSRSLRRLKGVQILDPNSARDFRMPVMADGRPYPAVVVRFDSPSALSRVRALNYVDFVEPLYAQVIYNAIGCGTPPYVGSTSDRTYTAGAPNLVSWNYAHHSILETWGLFPSSMAPGTGVDFFQTDTGVYPTQQQFSPSIFSQPKSASGRLFSHVLYGGDALTKCSHGTRIAGIAAAPADGSPTPNIVGVSWGSSLVSEKVGDGVVQFDTPTTGLTKAITDAATSAAVLPFGKRVVLMAWGMPAESQQVRDAIVSAYSNPNLIMIAAAGTVVPYVIFPATMTRETIAVSTVVTSDPAVFAYDLIPLSSGSDVVAYGREVDFVAVNDISMGLYVPTTGKGTNAAGQSVDQDGNLVPATTLPPADIVETTSLAGSSSAVAIIGGGMALGWSRMPWLTRDQLIARFVAASKCSTIFGLNAGCLDYASNRVVGSGIPDFYTAAGGARKLWIDGPPPTSAGVPFEIDAAMDGDTTLYDFQWSTGQTGTSAILTLLPGQTINVTLIATNRVDRTQLTASQQFSPTPATPRTLYATSAIESHAVFLDGQKLDSVINADITLPAGCFVTGVAGQELTVGGSAPGAPYGTPGAEINYNNRGFSVGRTAFSPQNLDVLVHAWHDGTSAIRVRPVYFILETASVDCNSGGSTQITP